MPVRHELAHEKQTANAKSAVRFGREFQLPVRYVAVEIVAGGFVVIKTPPLKFEVHFVVAYFDSFHYQQRRDNSVPALRAKQKLPACREAVATKNCVCFCWK